MNVSLTKPAGPWAAPLPAPVVTIKVLPGMNFAEKWKAAVENTLFEFPGGGTFTTTGLTQTKKNITLRSTGATPKLIGQNCPSEWSSIISVPRGMYGLHVEGFEFDDNDDTKFSAVSGDGSNVTVTKCVFTERLYRAVFAGATATGWTVYKNSAPRGLNTYFLYASLGSKYITFDWNTGLIGSVNEHWCRTHCDYLRAIGNDLTMMGNRKPGTGIKACLNIREGSNILIHKNVCRRGQTFIGGPLASETDKYLRNVLVTENQFLESEQNQFFEGMEDFVFEHNTIERKGGTGTCINIMPSWVSRPAPQGLVRENRWRGTSFISGDLSRIQQSGNVKL